MKRFLFYFLLLISVSSNSQIFRCIVAADGTGTDSIIQSAIDKCPENEKSIIFIKKGTYNGQTYIGAKATPSSKIISLIGEDPEQVILTYDKSLPMVTKFEEATTFQIYANDFYAENITFANSAGNTGQALALYTAGDRQTFKNCRILGYQDTYRSKKGTRGYFKNCWIEGAVDFIYAGGVEFFDDCTINCVNGGGYITAPEDAYVTIPKASTVCQKFLRVGFFFRNCDITANSDVPDNSYYLGRPWNSMAGTFYLNCKLGKHIKPAGWKDWSGNETSSSFAEYNSTDMNGIPIDTTSRVSWSFQLPKADVDSLLGLQAIYQRVSTEVYNPVPICTAPSAPTSVTLNGGTIYWASVDGVAGYIILLDGQYVSETSETSYTDNSGQTGVYSVKCVGALGQLSDATSTSTAIEDIETKRIKAFIKKDEILLSEPATVKLYTLNGVKLLTSEKCSSVSIKNLTNGVYVLQTQDTNNFINSQKLIIEK
ncbi:MAG: pectinesterase family protein [Paludibacter sp.]|nr:pectinesterase family protein [Paludibacter sp.]